MSQSSNDTYPTAMHIAAAEEIVRHLIASAEDAARRAGRQVQGLGRHHQDRPHPHPGRHPADAGPGVLRLRAAGAERHCAGRDDPADADAAGAGRHGRRHRPQRPRRLCRTGGRQNRREHQPALHLGAQQVRGAGGARRHGVHPRRAEYGGPRACSRSPTISACWAQARDQGSASCPCRRTSPARRSCRARSTRPSARR